MAKSAGTIASQPAVHDFIDLEQAGGTLDLKNWSAARNVHFTDIGTVEKRPGLRSIHVAFDATGQPIKTESTAPDDHAVGGLYHFRTTHNTGYESNLYLAKVNDYLVASQFGREFNVPVAKGLGGSGEQAYFSEVYRDSELKRYLIVGSSDPTFGVRYWDGLVLTSGSAYDRAKWGYMKRVPWIPVDFQFATEHNRRLVVAGSGTRVMFSESGDFLKFGAQIIMEPRWGRVTGFMPTYYGELLIGQEKAISKVIFGGGGLPDASETVTIEYGLVGPNASTHLGNDIVFMNTKGQLTSVATTDRFGSLETGLLSAKVFRRFDDLPKAAWKHVWVKDDPGESILWVGHARRSGLKNDSMTGWNYKVDRFEYVASEGLVGPSCAAVMSTSTTGSPRLHVGFYKVLLAGSEVAGRVFAFDSSHKEDCYLLSRTEGSGTADESIGDSGRIFLPGAAPLGGFTTQAQIDSNFTLTDSYSPSISETTIVLRIASITGVSIIGNAGATNIVAEIWDKGNSKRGTLSQDLGTAYTPGVAFSLTDGANDTGLDLAIEANVAVKVGQELFIRIHNRRIITEVWLNGIFDLAEGNVISTKSAGTARNFLPYVETPPVIFGDAHQDIRVDGISLMLRVKGNRADTQSPADVDNFTSQNQYRHMVDVYVKVDKDPTWQHIAIVDSNSAQRPHIDPSQAEIEGLFLDRVNASAGLSLQHLTATLDTEATGTPMASNDAVSLEYIKIERTGKIFQFRFGQETAISGGTNSSYGFRNGDFEIVGIHIHATPQREKANVGSLTVRIA